MLDGRYDRSKRKIVLGSGIGEAHAARPDPNWDSYDWERVAADAGMVSDRPLMRSINKPKAMANCLARLVQHKEHTRRPSLRAVSSATPIDALRVSQSLSNYARNKGIFFLQPPVRNRAPARTHAGCLQQLRQGIRPALHALTNLPC